MVSVKKPINCKIVDSMHFPQGHFEITAGMVSVKKPINCKMVDLLLFPTDIMILQLTYLLYISLLDMLYK